MFEIHILDFRSILNEFSPNLLNFQGSLTTSCECDFPSVLLAVLKVKMGRSTQNIFFAENENITPGAHLERFWNLFGHCRRFDFDQTLDPNLAISGFMYKLLCKMMSKILLCVLKRL